MSSSYIKLKENLSYLKLNQMIINLDEAMDFMNRNELSFTDTLIKLTDYEIDVKEINMIKSMVKVAGFPHLKEIKDFDFRFQPSINKDQILDFATLRFIEQQENIVFLGSSGVGKTHLATSIGIAAAKKRTSTYFIKCHDLILNLKKAQTENRLENEDEEIDVVGSNTNSICPEVDINKITLWKLEIMTMHPKKRGRCHR